jgi:phage terminase small subunit
VDETEKKTERRGGKRAGAGRKKSPPQRLRASSDDPVQFLLEVMVDPDADPKMRVRAAIAAAQYRHTKKGDGGKREDQANAAKKAGGGRFAPSAPPKLVVNNKS